MFTGVAKLEYHSSWLVANIEDDVLEYYRWWFYRRYLVKLAKPRWCAHISVIRGSEEEVPSLFLFENERKNKEVKFQYSNKLEQHPKGYVWMPCWGCQLEDVREECGFPRSPIMPFHMTVGVSNLL